jgi:crotonobetainyl-CoA:carnitine CoA-transferase CaiB-like acyl-CoA transferase
MTAPAPIRPLQGLKVVDFSTLLPGPMASLLLVEAGADVIKIERPGAGDEMRGYEPRFGQTSANFALLNRGKRSVALDLKSQEGRSEAIRLAKEADILIEQFRPGVMDRLGLPHAALSADNPGLIYCSITGYGQTGPKAQRAAHDLNYAAETGFLSLVHGADGTPSMTATPIADLAGGAYPAVINILMAVVERSRTGKGRHLDIAMADNLFPLLYWALGSGFSGRWPAASAELVTGGGPRYRIYPTADGRHLAAAPIEERFWARFCELAGVDETADADAVAAVIAGKSADEWRQVFAGEDVCCSIVEDLQTAVDDPHVQARGLFRRTVSAGGERMPALPVPLVEDYRDPEADREAPALAQERP